MFCNNCGKKLEDDWTFCDECGCKVNALPEQEITLNNVQNKKSGFKFYMIVIIIAVMICVLGFVIITAVDDKQHKEAQKKIDALQNSYFENPYQ